MARPDLKASTVSADMALAALCHGPASDAAAIQRNIDCAMTLWRSGWIFLQGPVVIGRKHTADKGNDGQAKCTVIT